MSTTYEFRDATGALIDLVTVGSSALGTWPGDKSGVLYDTVAALARVVGDVDARAADLKLAPIGPQERAERTGRAALEALASINPRATAAAESVAAIARDIEAVNPAGDPRALSYLEVQTDLEVARVMKGMRPIERAELVARMQANPTAPEVQDYMRAAIRTPAVLTGLSPQERRAVTLKAYEVAAPEHAAALKAAAEQAGHAINAARIAVRTLSQHGARMTPDQSLVRLANMNPPTWS